MGERTVSLVDAMVAWHCRKLAQGSSVDEDGKDLDAQHSAEDEQSFLSLDDIPEDKNINLVENGTS
jgi:hypothetical protein